MKAVTSENYVTENDSICLSTFSLAKLWFFSNKLNSNTAVQLINSVTLCYLWYYWKNTEKTNNK